MPKPNSHVAFATVVLAGFGLVGAACSTSSHVKANAGWATCSASAGRPVANGQPRPPGPGDVTKIKHVIMIMQENRSFDQYFGTYPGADGIPRKNGVSTVCVPDPNGNPVRPYHSSADLNGGGPHTQDDAVADIAGGKMNGFVTRRALAGKVCRDSVDPVCTPKGVSDVMSYHDAREIPNYWSYAANFVLQDHMFSSDDSWSLPAHLFAVSAWSAHCASPTDPMSCTNDNSRPIPPKVAGGGKPPRNFAWTDLTYLLHAHGVSWGYYIAAGNQPDCADGDMVCSPKKQKAGTPSIWNPLPNFATVKADGELGNIQPVQNFYSQAQHGTLPAVSWVVPNQPNSEHPPALVSTGQSYVTGLINAVMAGPDWSSSAIFLAWDDWGGFFDHVVPPRVDQNGYGLRVPGLLISPYAKRGLVDHQTLSFDAYLKFIEDRFLGGEGINPAIDGRPDPRPTVRETVPILGDLRAEFDFTQTPRGPVLLPLQPPPGPASS